MKVLLLLHKPLKTQFVHNIFDIFLTLTTTTKNFQMKFFSSVFTSTLPLTGLWSFTSSNSDYGFKLAWCDSTVLVQIRSANTTYMNKLLQLIHLSPCFLEWLIVRRGTWRSIAWKRRHDDIELITQSLYFCGKTVIETLPLYSNVRGCL